MGESTLCLKKQKCSEARKTYKDKKWAQALVLHTQGKDLMEKILSSDAMLASFFVGQIRELIIA